MHFQASFNAIDLPKVGLSSCLSVGMVKTVGLLLTMD